MTWVPDEPEGKKPPTDGGVVIHHLNDGCSHVFAAEPLPMSVVTQDLPVPLGAGGAHVFPEERAACRTKDRPDLIFVVVR